MKNELYQLAVRNLGSGQYKIVKARKLTAVNQFKRTWKQVNAREVARELNRSELIIK
jgi:hypothetical protein